MSFERAYNLKCDNCAKVHITTCPTPRRARAAAKRDGWQRRQVVVGTHLIPDYKLDPYRGGYVLTGHTEFDTTAGRDFCPACLDKMDELTP